MTNTQIINIAKSCISLVVRDIEKGIEKDLLLPRKLYVCYKATLDAIALDSTDIKSPNYLYSLCGGYAFEAENKMGAGGIVVNPSTGGTNSGLTPFPINVTISSGEAGVSILQSSAWIGLQDVNSVVINQSILQKDVQFTFNSVTGVFNFSLYGYILQTNDQVSSFGFMPV
jgi:hypothetical protein